MIFMAIPFLGIWLLYSSYVIRRRPEKRRVQVVRVVILTTTLVGIAGLHSYYYISARAAGDYAEHLVSAYKAEHANYPDTLEEAGWNTCCFKQDLKKLRALSVDEIHKVPPDPWAPAFFSPVVDGYVVAAGYHDSYSTGLQNKVDFMAGGTAGWRNRGSEDHR
jgi:hypothetical protein